MLVDLSRYWEADFCGGDGATAERCFFSVPQKKPQKWGFLKLSMLFMVDNFNLSGFSEIISIFLIDNFNLPTFYEIISLF